MPELDTPIIEATASVTLDDGEQLTETVGLALRDFAVDSVRAAAYWESEDPDTFSSFMDGSLTVADFAKSAVKLQAFLYALIRANVSDSRIRERMTPSDFAMAFTELQAIAASLEE